MMVLPTHSLLEWSLDGDLDIFLMKGSRKQSWVTHTLLYDVNNEPKHPKVSLYRSKHGRSAIYP